MGKKDAYLAVYKGKTSTAYVASSRFEKNRDIQEKIKWFQNKTETSSTLTRIEKREFLAKVVRAKASDLTDDSPLVESVTCYYDQMGNLTRKVYSMPSKAACIQIDNKMAGHNEPERVEVNVSGGVMLVPASPCASSLDAWEKLAAEQQEALIGGGNGSKVIDV